jgi:hypothetical protein
MTHSKYVLGNIYVFITLPEQQSRANIGRGMITRPIWKCPCIKLFITYFRHLEKRHPYWPETKSRHFCMTGSKLSIFSHPWKITGYWITRSFPYRGPYWSGQFAPRLCLRPIWVSLFHNFTNRLK